MEKEIRKVEREKAKEEGGEECCGPVTETSTYHRPVRGGPVSKSPPAGLDSRFVGMDVLRTSSRVGGCGRAQGLCADEVAAPACGGGPPPGTGTRGARAAAAEVKRRRVKREPRVGTV